MCQLQDTKCRLCVELRCVLTGLSLPPLLIVARVGLTDIDRNRKSLARSGGRNRSRERIFNARFGGAKM